MIAIFTLRFCLFCWYLQKTLSTLSNPLKEDSQINNIIPDYQDVKKTKMYYNFTPILRHDVPIINHQLLPCGIDAKVQWSATVGSSVYSTPVIFPSGPQGRKQIFLNTFYQFIEVIGDDGFKPWGFPLTFSDSSFQTSPILYDVDGDGVNDMTVIDKNANIYWIRLGDYGQYLEDFHVQVPKLKVKKDWAAGMDPAFLDSYVLTSMFDNRFDGKKTDNVAKPDDLKIFVKQDSYPEQNMQAQSQTTKRKLHTIKLNKQLHSAEVEEVEQTEQVDSQSQSQSSNHWTGRVLSQVEEENPQQLNPEETITETEGGEEKPTEERGAEPFEEEEFDHMIYNPHDDVAPDTINPLNGGDPIEWVDDYNVHRHFNRRSYFGDDYYPAGYGWGYNDSHFAFVDPHVLSSATLADINNDGDMDLLIPISYYFDKEQYRGRELDFDPNDFLAGGVGCWNIRAERWNWLVHLDLTTDKTKFKALIHSSPTVADLDGDGRSEVIIGTSLGLLYVLDGDTGFSRRFFPMQFHEIQSQVAVGDIRGGSDLEMIVGDLAGNLVCVNIEGDVLWDARLSGGIYQPATIGDVDGDGQLDVVVSVSAYNGYHIYALRGDTGEILAGYPIALPEGGEVSGAILLVDLHTPSSSSSSSSKNILNPSKYSDPYAPQWTVSSVGHAPAASPSSFASPETPSLSKTTTASESEGEEEEESSSRRRRLEDLDPISHKIRSNMGGGNIGVKRVEKKANHNDGLHLIVPSFDGHLYIFDGKQTCAERIDIGDHIFSTPLVDDVTGDGNLDIIIGTVNGHLHVLETQVPHHPLNSWTSFPKHRGNVFTHGQTGISIPLREKKLLRQTDVKGGRKLALTFDIWDTRPIVESEKRKYSVIVTHGTNKIHPIHSVEYTQPGRYTIELDLSPPEKLMLIIGMNTDHQQYYEDSIEIELSTRFYIWIKYLIVIPMIILIVPLLFMRPQKGF